MLQQLSDQSATLIIDATSATDRLTGIERYTRELTKKIAELRRSHGAHTTILLSHNADWLPVNDSGISVKHSPFRSRLLTEQIWIPYIIGKLSPTSCFFPAFPPSPLVFLTRTGKIIHTIFDATMWKHPETLSWKNKMYMRPLETFGIGHYDVIHTISQYSADEISCFFPSTSGRMVNSSIGIDLDSFAKEPAEEEFAVISKKYGLPQKFILFVGTIEPRKNLPFLLHVIDALRHSMPECHLVMAGREGWGSAEVRQLIQSLHLEKNVSILGSVPDTQLPSLYRLASLFVFPSIYEGFGLPVIEAMASGTPVIASNASSIPEAAGDAAILLSPHDKSAWVESIQRVLGNAELSSEMRVAGREQATRFSWRSVALKILESAV